MAVAAAAVAEVLVVWSADLFVPPLRSIFSLGWSKKETNEVEEAIMKVVPCTLLFISDFNLTALFRMT